MLEVLRRIVQEVNAADDLHQALRLIVERVKQSMAVDVCSIYLVDTTTEQHVLMATEGLNPESVGTVRMDYEHGLVSLVAERAEPVNLSNATEHPRYEYFPETGEERFLAFLGVPIIHHRQVLGVLVVQRRTAYRFVEDEVTFLITVASQLAGGIAHAEVSGGIRGLVEEDTPEAIFEHRPLQGLAAAPGVAMGHAVVVYNQADLNAVPDRATTTPEEDEMRLLEAVSSVRQEVDDLAARMRDHLPSEELALFDAYRMMLDSNSLSGQIAERIRAGQWAPGALRQVFDEHVRAFSSMDDPYLAERADDIRDLGRRILVHLQRQEQQQPPDYPDRVVLIGEEIVAANIAEVPPEKLAGVVSMRGSRNSHAAILARAMGLPAVMGVNHLPVSRMDGRSLIADGYSGRVYINPSQEVWNEYQRLVSEEEELTAGLTHLRELPAETTDGVRIPLYVNTGLVSDMSASRQSGAEGIGLYRTEFPFMIRERFPGEEEQAEVYRTVLESFEPRPVILRTLDVGGDKALPYFPINEDNPFLGWRGIRITLDHPEIFMVQLRAMLQASLGFTNLNLLLPMIGSVAELDEALTLLRRAHRELHDEGIPVTMPRVGVMVEVPSAVYLADRLAARVDFLSIGTNDLTQYLLAVDRNNARVAELYDALHPAVLAAMQQTLDGARRHQCPVSVCGEMAGDPAAVILLLAMGMDSLSTSVSSLPRVKWVIRSISHARAREILEEVREYDDPAAIRGRLDSELDRLGLGGLIRAGK
ncbi:MAG: phosphoenolpyruvate--protein phosphotransferase [Pseudomonadota bacterium]